MGPKHFQPLLSDDQDENADWVKILATFHLFPKSHVSIPSSSWLETLPDTV